MPKIIQVGNSIAMTIPQGFAKEANYKPGQQVEFDGNTANESFFVKKITANPKTTVVKTPELTEWLEKFNKKYKKGLTELAKK
jgi:antitoxin component of MazEF toxin-antitoxin module